MNIESLHPILVHFPIAILSLYAITEMIRFKKVVSLPAWFGIKAFLSIFGAVSSCAAFATGPEGAAAKAWAGFTKEQTHALIEVHSSFAALTVLIFSVLAISYIITLLGKKYSLPAFISKLGVYMQKPCVTISLSVIGFVAVLFTGSLGGALVFGPEMDPFVSVIYHLFF